MKRFAEDQEKGKQITRSLLDVEDCAYMGGKKDNTTEGKGLVGDDRIKFAQKTFGVFSVQVLACLISLTLVINETIDKSIGSKPITITCFVLGFATTLAAICMRSRQMPIDLKKGLPMFIFQTICFSLGVASLSAMKIFPKNQDTGVQEVNEGAKTLLLVCMITSLIIIILIIAASKFILGDSSTTKKIGPTFGILLTTGVMFYVIANMMGITTGKFTSALVLMGIIGFFVIDANMILSGKYEGKKNKKQ